MDDLRIQNLDVLDLVCLVSYSNTVTVFSMNFFPFIKINCIL